MLYVSGKHPYRAQRAEKIAAGAILLIVSSRIWLPLLGGFLIVADRLQHADALVPLAGDPTRVITAAQLFRQGYARWFIATSMPDPSAPTWHGYADKVVRRARSLHVPGDAILIAPGMVTTTYAEATLLRQLAQARGWHSLLVVTSPSHTRRAQMIFREIFAGADITVVVHPIADRAYTADSWWKSIHGIQQALLEYLKLALYLGGYHKLFPGSIQGGS